MKKRLFCFLLVFCMLAAYLPAALATNDPLAYRELDGNAKEGWEENLNTPLTTDGDLKLETTGSICIALYNSDRTTKVPIDKISVSDVLDDTNKYLSISIIKSPAGDDIVQITVEKGMDGTLKAVDGQDETLAEVELTTAGQSTTPTFSLCTLEKGSYEEVGQTIRLASNIQTMTLYMVKNEDKVVEKRCMCPCTATALRSRMMTISTRMA